MKYSLEEIKQKTRGWFSEKNEPSWFHRQIISVLKCGSIPKHIAIIMDGNRRYARQLNIERQDGHMKGFDKLSETLEWCLDLGINEVTVYAFSIENFKRSSDEVDGLMDLFRVKMQQLIDEREKLEQHGVCIRILGAVSLLPDDVQHLIQRAVQMSSTFNRAYLNVCVAYTSREEMTNSVRRVAMGISSGLLEESDVDGELLESCMYTASCQPVDILLRTSGEVRLSDFLLWQSSYSMLSFVDVLWPEFSRWHLYSAVLLYQRYLPSIQKIQEEHKKIKDTNCKDTSVLLAESVERKTVFLAS